MLHSIRLQNYRSYADTTFDLDKGVNVIIGKNGTGKTNLLESILVLCNGSSYRSNDSKLVSFHKDWARLDGELSDGKRSVKIEVTSSSTSNKSFIIDEKKVVRLTQKNKLPTVLFEPNHLQLLIRGPEVRRTFLDEMLIKFSPGYSILLNHYKRTLAQRNRLLKINTKSSLEQLFVWDVRLSDIGGKIVEKRHELIDDINKKIEAIYSDIADKESNIIINYVSKTNQENYSTQLLKQLKTSLESDIIRGFTTHGPHRDDIEFILNNDNAADTASRGETRTILLSLKIYELLELEKLHNTKPILLLDDVFSELDTTRQHALVNYFKDHQVIITTTDIKALIKGVRGKIFQL